MKILFTESHSHTCTGTCKVQGSTFMSYVQDVFVTQCGVVVVDNCHKLRSKQTTSTKKAIM